VPKERIIKAKKRCCKDVPRCKSCPVVCKRLQQAGFAEKLTHRTFLVNAPKPALKAARARAAG
jgi:hypothetical protein